MIFFNRNWAGARWNCWAGPLTLNVRLPYENKKQKRIDEVRLLPLQCLSQFFMVEEKINCLGNEFLVCTFHRWGDLVFIMDDHDNLPSWVMTQIFLPLCEEFSFLIVNQLIRDN